jgi:hypothetical protein
MSNQRGGNAPACLDKYTAGLAGSSCGTANMHNVNPQASLDNVVNPYGSSVPLGQALVGGGNCGNEGSGTNNLKSNTFKQYINNMSKSLDVNLNGGGYTVDPSKYVAGMPIIGGYDDCCPPAIINKKIVSGGPDQVVCGLGAIRGGGRRRRNKNKSKKNNKHGKRTKINNCSKSNMHRGGGDFNGATRSKPALYSDAFNGEPSILEYPADMSKRDFSARQPNYGPNAL